MRLKAATGANIFIRKVPAKDGQDLDTISKIIFAQITQGQQAKKGKSGDTQLAGQAAKFLNYQDQIGQDSLQSKSWITARDESVFIISWTCLKADADETGKLLSAAVESIGFQ